VKCPTPVGSEAFLGTRARACSFGLSSRLARARVRAWRREDHPAALHALALLVSGAAPDVKSFGGERDSRRAC
jgi:hypothetical protein